MEDFAILVHVKCGGCGHSLMNPNLEIDGVPSIDLEAKVRAKLGHIYLSQVYGSYETSFSGVEDIPGSIAAFSCPHCHEPFPVARICSCGAPQMSLCLEIGGTIRFCARNGCREHAIEFERVTDLFRVFESQHYPAGIEAPARPRTIVLQSRETP